MTSAKDFLGEFAQDIVNDPQHRDVLIAGWASHLEARELAYPIVPHGVRLLRRWLLLSVNVLSNPKIAELREQTKDYIRNA